MAYLHHDSQIGTAADKLFPCFSESGPGIRTRRETERNSMAKGIRPAPDRSDRSNTESIPVLKVNKRRIDGFGTLEMQNYGQLSFISTSIKLGSAPRK